MTKISAASRKLWKELREFALGLPGAYEDHPWGESVAKVNKKVFVFMGTESGHEKGFGMSVKLPESNGLALTLPFTEPTGYGLGKGGWVSVYFVADDLPPADMMKEWILESYRAIAPKKLAAELGGAPPPAAAPKPRAAKSSGAGASAKGKAKAKAAPKAAAPAKPKVTAKSKATAKPKAKTAAPKRSAKG